jgi:diaminopimelate decarboxylase
MDRELRIAAIGVSQLVADYGTPLYVYDGAVVREQYLRLRAALHPALEVFYSLKANPNLSVCALLRSLGARAEVSSLVELMTARQAGVAPSDIIFLGPGKSESELTACLDEDIYAVICESLDELSLLDELARRRGRVARVALRVNPAFAVKGAGLTMSGRPRQFGIDEEQLRQAGDRLRSLSAVTVVGVQAYVGTRILSESVIADNIGRVLALAENLSRRLDFELDLVDVGGGFGVAYFDNERDLDLAELSDRLNPVIETFAVAHPATRLVLELGRYLTAPAGTYLVRVRYVKTSVGENFAIADGGTNHHLTAVGIGSPVKRNFPVRLVNRLDEEPTGSWHVTGPLCTPNDTLAKAVALPEVRPGDLIGILRSGAYGPSASPGLFLSHGFPAEVLIDSGAAYLVRERDTPADILRPQRLHPSIGSYESGRNAMPESTVQSSDAIQASDAMPREALLGSVAVVLGRVLKQDLPELTEEVRLMEDLNLDSTSVLELLLELEDELDIQIDVEGIEQADFATVGALADLVSRQSTD